MNFTITSCFNFDLLNLMNVLTGHAWYTSIHPLEFEKFGKTLSENSRRRMVDAITANNGSSMLGPVLCLWISSLPDFDTLDVTEALSDMDTVFEHLASTPYRVLDSAQATDIAKSIVPIAMEVQHGFRDHWNSDLVSKLEQRRHKVEESPYIPKLGQQLEWWLGVDESPKGVELYLGSLAAPHGMKLCGPRYISDVSCTLEDILTNALHEMFHPPYHVNAIGTELSQLSDDALLRRAYENQHADCRYEPFSAFVEENVVEAMAITSSTKIGLMSPSKCLQYFEKHDHGSHVFSVILIEEFAKRPKPQYQRFEEYFRDLVGQLPLGSLQGRFDAIRHRGLVGVV